MKNLMWVRELRTVMKTDYQTEQDIEFQLGFWLEKIR